MATYASLSDEQKARLAEHATVLRAAMGELARLLNHCEAVDALYNAEASVVLSELDASEEIPNPTGLSEAAPLTQAETITLQSYVQGLINDASSFASGFNTTAMRQNYVRAAGAAQTIG